MTKTKMARTEGISVAALAARWKRSDSELRRKIRDRKLPGWKLPLGQWWVVCKDFVLLCERDGKPPTCRHLRSGSCEGCLVPQLLRRDA